ncbi:MAG: 1-deoxy-D-xylulose-5-phosphate reductoisomerase [Bacteroidales bacterium]|uniref:1-deoxy-D-xylulose-5-phosphate reductoisomerase n=1 Tax=Porphyromonas sp. TaxID=1924944 RepID=UPI002972D5F7|nr:1-deoxy-D-xylulose-5-phosphate reductoisomerase [Porphyromonas sp.]MDD7438493.1 1-deoxy-D-xylulose-5-phosphate reductoisomerase [Bacteroidales bacterium]MDY3067076.1 1-deoxy-D-xylulose-5-phosphate reductoisomerase [Porphyromonas sp.]
MRKVTILGSTGSIGTQALQVIERHPDELGVYALVANNSIELLVEQARKFRPEVVAIGNEKLAKELKKVLKGDPIEVVAGREEIIDLAASVEADVVLTAMVGFAGLEPTISAIKTGRSIALANKETLVVAGDLIKQLCKEHTSMILPVDSEHSAIFQCLVGEQMKEVEKIYLTASGGPFVDMPTEMLSQVKAEDALKHPNWSMGTKVTIDSATMMNKGLEMIEAHHLFNIAAEDIEVVVHRQSIVHSMVGYRDGSVKAQLSYPDMRHPIAYALLYPHRYEGHQALLKIEDMAKLTFEPPRRDAFPCLDLAYEALHRGGTSPCTMNAANEVAVQRFLKGQIAFTDIPKVIRYTMDKAPERNASSLALLQDADQVARDIAQAWYDGLK